MAIVIITIVGMFWYPPTMTDSYDGYGDDYLFGHYKWSFLFDSNDHVDNESLVVQVIGVLLLGIYVYFLI